MKWSSSGIKVNIKGGCYFLACKYVLCPVCSLVPPWRQTPLHSPFLFVPAGVRKCFTQACVRSLGSTAVRGSGLSGHSKDRQHLGLLKCSTDGDTAPDLWSEYELGGSCAAREADYWGRGEGNSPEWKKFETKRERRRFTYPHPAVRSYAHGHPYLRQRQDQTGLSTPWPQKYPHSSDLDQAKW